MGSRALVGVWEKDGLGLVSCCLLLGSSWFLFVVLLKGGAF